MPKTRSRIAAPVEKLSECVSFECFECLIFFDAHGVESRARHRIRRATVFAVALEHERRLSTSTMRIHSAPPPSA